MQGITEGFPMACLPIGHQALISHQIRYLEANGLFHIFVVLQQDNMKKVQNYLMHNFTPDSRTNLTLVIVQEEETESATALKLMQQLQHEQELQATMPEYERTLLRSATGKNHMPMDDLDFSGEEVIIMEGSAFLDFKLDKILNEHYLTKAALTSVARELNLAVKPPVDLSDESHEIIGLTELAETPSCPKNDRLKRLVLKTDNDAV